MSSTALQTLLLILLGKATAVLDENPLVVLVLKPPSPVSPDGGRGAAAGLLLLRRATAQARAVVPGSPLRPAAAEELAAW